MNDETKELKEFAKRIFPEFIKVYMLEDAILHASGIGVLRPETRCIDEAADAAIQAAVAFEVKWLEYIKGAEELAAEELAAEERTKN